MIYYVISVITLVSALVGLFFAIQATRNGRGIERTNALYMFSRSIATVLIAGIPLFQKSSELLIIATLMMLIVQLIDGVVGVYIKDKLGTVGPFILVIIHAICLGIYL